MATRTYSQIQSEIERLQGALLKERASILAQLRAQIQMYGFTAGELGLAGTAARAPAKRSRSASAAPSTALPARHTARGSTLGKVPPKYRDAAGNTWTGRGSMPRWLRAALASGAALEQFRI